MESLVVGWIVVWDGSLSFFCFLFLAGGGIVITVVSISLLSSFLLLHAALFSKSTSSWLCPITFAHTLAFRVAKPQVVLYFIAFMQ